MLTIGSQRPLFDIPAGIALWFAKISQRQTRPLATRAEAAMLNYGRPRYPDCSAPDCFGEPTSKSRFENLALRQQLAVYHSELAAGAIGALAEKSEAPGQTYANATRGLPALKITNVKTILTCPQGGNYVVVKVETSEPGLYGVGSATLTTRGAAVATSRRNSWRPSPWDATPRTSRTCGRPPTSVPTGGTVRS